MNIVTIIVATALAILALGAVNGAREADQRQESIIDSCIVCTTASQTMLEASNFLTTEARMYVTTGYERYLEAYLTEYSVTNRRDHAVETLRILSDGGTSLQKLETALKHSNDLAQREFYAMRLMAEATNMQDLPDELANVQLSEQDQSLNDAEKRERATDIMFGDNYLLAKNRIDALVAECTDAVMNYLYDQQQQTNNEMLLQHGILQATVFLLLALVVSVIFANIVLVLRPLTAYANHIGQGSPLQSKGAYELQYLARAYNLIYEENGRQTDDLRRAAECDPLTQLFNRSAYNKFIVNHTATAALLLIDVDKFKEVNDEYGHDVGDAVLKKVADKLQHSFRSHDLPCRLGGDEFAVVMTDMNPGLKQVICNKLADLHDALRDTADGLPPVTVSVGIAFGNGVMDEDDLYRAADKALYDVKAHGRDGYEFYGESEPSHV